MDNVEQGNVFRFEQIEIWSRRAERSKAFSFEPLALWNLYVAGRNVVRNYDAGHIVGEVRVRNLGAFRNWRTDHEAQLDFVVQ